MNLGMGGLKTLLLDSNKMLQNRLETRRQDQRFKQQDQRDDWETLDLAASVCVVQKSPFRCLLILSYSVTVRDALIASSFGPCH